MEGTRLGPYQLLAEVGSGGMGTVYRAEVAGPVPGMDPGCSVALKVIHAHLLEAPGFFKRFLREADIGRTIEHENVVRTYDCDALLHDGTQQNFLVMEYVEGQTLRDLLYELDHVPEALCRHIGREVANGLAAIHQAGVVHRDLKPENVLITADHVVKIMDLGVARLRAETIRLSQTGAFVGSLEYAAPEQFHSSDGEPDGRADLHALGVVLYELATGQHPYRDEDAAKVLRRILEDQPRKVGELNPQLSPFLEEVVQTLIAKDPEARFGSAADLAHVLAEEEQGAWWKGRAQALRIETKRPLRRIRIPRETALYGRDDDVARLRALYEEAKAGDGRVLLIEGEAGIGKTRLVDEFVGRLRQDGEDVNFLFGSYPPGGAATACGAFSEAYREQFGDEGLDETLADYLTATPLLVPAFAALLKGDAPPREAEPLTKDALQTVFVHATRSLAAQRPTVVLIDDLHFAPDDGRALFTSLAFAVPDHRILLVGTLRPGVPEEWMAGITRLDHAEQRSLSRLGLKDFSALLKDAFRSDRLALDLAGKIGEKSDGNPFFAFEIIRGLREGRFISQQPDGTWVKTKAIEDIQVPSSVLDLVNARVGDLTDDERNFLDVASCLGFEFDSRVVAAVLELPRIAALQMLAKIEKRHRLVRAVGRRFVFDHHQVQEALYGGLSDLLREEYHAAIADVLWSRAGSAEGEPDVVDGALAAALCDHYLKGTRPQDALPFLEAAEDHLVNRSMNEPAAALAEAALAPPSLLVGEDRARVLLRLGGGEGPYDTLGRYASAEAACAEAERWAVANGEDGYAAQAACDRGIALQKLGRWEEAEAAVQRSIACARRIGDPSVECRALSAWGNLHYYRGQKARAKDRYEKALAISHATGDELLEATAQNNLANAYTSAGEFAEARSHLMQALVRFKNLNDTRAQVAIEGNMAALSFSLGRVAEALEYCERYLGGSRACGRRWGIANAASIAGELHLLCGRLTEAKAKFQEAVALYEEMGVPTERVLALYGVARVLHAEGAHASASAMIADVLNRVRDLGVTDLECECHLSTGRRLWEEGRPEEALDRFREACARRDELGLPDLLGLAPCHLALVSPGDVEAAQAAVREYSPRMTMSSALDAQALLWKATHEPRHLVEAKRLLDHLVEHAPQACRESMLKNVPLHREIMEAWASRDPEPVEGGDERR